MIRALVILLGIFAVSCAAAKPVIVDGVAAYVNGQAITVGDVMRLLAPEFQRLQSVYQGQALQDKMNEKFRDKLDLLVETQLILAAFQADKKADTAAVDREVDHSYDEFLREKFGGDRAAFGEALKEESMTPEEWRQHIRESMIVNYLRGREVEQHIIVSPAEVRSVYEARAGEYQRPAQVHLRLAQFRGGEAADAQAAARRRAEESRGQLLQGADFGAVARKETADTHAASGGDWGWIEPKELRAELAAVVGTLPTNTVSAVVAADGDCYLLRVEERRLAGAVPFEEVRKTIERDLRMKEGQRLYTAWIARLKRNAYVKICEDNPFKDE